MMEGGKSQNSIIIQDDLNFFKDDKFYIYGDIDSSTPRAIIQPLIEEIEKNSKLISPKPIEFFINSAGGDIDFCWDIITIFESAKKKNVEIQTYVLSCAASAASLIAACGHFRYVSKRAYHLLHFARGWDYAHNPEMVERNAQHFKFMQKKLVEIYQEYTKIKDVEKKLLADNFMVNGGTALVRAGLADQII